MARGPIKVGKRFELTKNTFLVPFNGDLPFVVFSSYLPNFQFKTKNAGFLEKTVVNTTSKLGKGVIDLKALTQCIMCFDLLGTVDV